MNFRLPNRIRFSRLAVALLVALTSVAGLASAASYEQVDGTVVDPILDRATLLPHAYTGINLAPGVDLNAGGALPSVLTSALLVEADLRGAQMAGTDLASADLTRADLVGTTLTGADLAGATLVDAVLVLADLSGADLSGADLSGAVLTSAIVAGADFRGASFVESVGLGGMTGSPIFDANTDFSNAWAGAPNGAVFDPIAAGWTLVPEPGAALLVGLGLAGLAVRRR